MQLTAHGYLIHLSAFQSLVSQTRDLGKTLHVSGADGRYQCFIYEAELLEYWERKNSLQSDTNVQMYMIQ